MSVWTKIFREARTRTRAGPAGQPVQRDEKEIGLFLAGKAVVVTRAGGSIGWELWRRIVRLKRARVLLVERGEFTRRDGHYGSLIYLARVGPKSSGGLVELALKLVASLRGSDGCRSCRGKPET